MDTRLGALMARHGPGALVATAPDGGVEIWTPAAEAVFGLAGEAAVGRKLADLIVPPDLRDDEAAARAEALAAGSSERFDLLRLRGDGVPIYVNCSMRAVREGDGDRVLLLSHLTDTTRWRARRDAELVLARFHAVLEPAPDAIVIVNPTGRIVLFNAQATTVFGYPAAEMIGEPIERLLPARLRGGHVGLRAGYTTAPRLRAMGEGRELHGLRASGEEFPVEVSLSPIETDAGRLVMSAIRDISERKRIERTLHEKNVELERASRAKDRFLATMSHELRTPLNAIIGFTGLMLMKLPGPLTPDQEKQLTMVQSSGKHLLSLINDLLDLAKIESGTVSLQLEDVPAAPALEEVVQTLRPAAQAKGLVLQIVPPPPSLRVRADRRALQQILINLANNAVKFTQRGSVTMTASADGDQVAFAVVDTGIGISAEDRQRLFQAFTQVGDLRVQGRPEGTGLGLHLSAKLAALMNGRIDVDSEPGRGSCFTLRLERGG